MRLGKYVFMIRALRVSPEFQHAARRVKSPVDSSLSLELANITDIDQNRGASLLLVKRLLRRDGVGLTFRCRNQRFNWGDGCNFTSLFYSFWRQRAGGYFAAGCAVDVAP